MTLSLLSCRSLHDLYKFNEHGNPSYFILYEDWSCLPCWTEPLSGSAFLQGFAL